MLSSVLSKSQLFPFPGRNFPNFRNFRNFWSGLYSSSLIYRAGWGGPLMGETFICCEIYILFTVIDMISPAFPISDDGHNYVTECLISLMTAPFHFISFLVPFVVYLVIRKTFPSSVARAPNVFITDKRMGYRMGQSA